MSDTSSARTIIYREYIKNHLPITVNPEYKVVDLIIGFASEDYNPKGEGTGNFHPTWNLVAIGPEEVKNLKEKYPQIRLVISIGGAGTQYPFNPADKDRWSGAAAKSVKELIQIYGNLIDGIDIHYDVIKSSPDDFSKSIGEVIERLKNDPHLTIKVVSIAPNEDFRWHYQKLVSEYHTYIDFVDYCFINKNFPIIDFVDFYKGLVAEYKPVPVLPGYLSTTIPDDKSKDAVIYLINHKIAPGYFTYGYSAIVRTDIYREYVLKRLPTTVNPEYNVVDLNIGFASEDYNPKGEGTGNFHPSWNIVAFSPEKVKQLKEKYPQVRVVISIGGVGTQYPFNPADNGWSDAAVKSIQEIIQIYGKLIDGIDIHYDVIKSSPDEFTKSIGEVIEKLKNDLHLNIKVVSIAPNEDTQWQYRKLVSERHSYINFVDYLFTKPIADVEEFYDERVAEYKPVLVLPGYLSPTIPGDKSKEAVEYLVNHKIAPGYFTYPSDSGDLCF